MKHPEIASTCFFWRMLMASTGLKLLTAIGAAFRGLGDCPLFFCRIWYASDLLSVSKAEPRKFFLGFWFTSYQNIKDSDIKFVSHKKMHVLIRVQGLEWKAVSSWVQFYIWKFIKIKYIWTHSHTFMLFVRLKLIHSSKAIIKNTWWTYYSYLSKNINLKSEGSLSVPPREQSSDCPEKAFIGNTLLGQNPWRTVSWRAVADNYRSPKRD